MPHWVERVGDVVGCSSALATYLCMENHLPGLLQNAVTQEFHAALLQTVLIAWSPSRALTVLCYRLSGSGFTLWSLIPLLVASWGVMLVLPLPYPIIWLLDTLVLGLLYWWEVQGVFKAVFLHLLGVPAGVTHFVSWRGGFAICVVKILFNALLAQSAHSNTDAVIRVFASQLFHLGVHFCTAFGWAMTPEFGPTTANAFWAGVWSVMVNHTAVPETVAAAAPAAAQAAAAAPAAAGEWAREAGSQAAAAVPGIIAVATTVWGWLGQL